MRLLIPILVAIAGCNISCEQKRFEGASFQVATQWSAAETASLQQLSRDYRPASSQVFMAVWTNGDSTRGVYLDRGGVQSITEPYRVFSFDDTGLLLKLNEISIYTGYEPRLLLSVDPLRVAFGVPGARRADRVGEGLTDEGWQQHTQKLESLLRELRTRREAEKATKPE